MTTQNSVPGDGPAPEAADGPQRESAVRAPGARAIGLTRYVILCLIWSILLIAMTISIFAPIYTVARLWSVFNDAATGNIVAHEGVLRVFDLVVVALEAVAFYLVGIGLYHFFIAPLALAEELGLDTMDKLESKLVSVIVVMAALIFLHHLILGKNPVDILYYAVGVGIIISALTWFKRQLD